MKALKELFKRKPKRPTTRENFLLHVQVENLKSANATLQHRLDQADSRVFCANHKVHELEKDNANLRQALHKAESELAIVTAPESKLRAFVMSLRVHEMQGAGATGYGVTAFIPTGAIEALQKADAQTQLQFAQIIAAELVARALNGLWFINSRGTRCALVFDPATGGAAGVVFDSATGPEMKLARSTGPATNNLQRLSHNPEAAEKYHRLLSHAENKEDAVKLLVAAAKLPREADGNH